MWCGPWEWEIVEGDVFQLPRAIVGFSFLIERGIVGFWPPLQETIDDHQVSQTMGIPSEKERATKSEENRRLLFGFQKEREEAPTDD